MQKYKSKFKYLTSPKNKLNHKAHKEHKDFLFVSLLNPKSQILKPNFSFCFLIFNILFTWIGKIKRDFNTKKTKSLVVII